MGAVESLMMDDHTGSPASAAEIVAQVKEAVAKATENYIGGPTGCPVGPEGEPGYATLTNEERLEVENLSLRIQLVASTRTNYIQEVNETLRGIDTQLTELRSQITSMQKALTVKYGVDFTKQQIQAGTGRIIPAPSQT